MIASYTYGPFGEKATETVRAGKHFSITLRYLADGDLLTIVREIQEVAAEPAQA